LFEVDRAVAGERILVMQDVGVEPKSCTLVEYAWNGASWDASAKIDLPARPSSLARVGDDEWIVGSRYDGTGSVMHVTRTKTGFATGARWTDPRAIGAARFGASLAVTGSTVFVGAPGQGRVHVFERTASVPVH
jgi:hypothetical protein